MSIFTGIMVYLMVFWTMLFCILPWGNRADNSPKLGTNAGAPANPRIKQKFIITAIISSIIWLLIWSLIRIEVIDYYEMARQMVEEDKLR